MHNIIADYIADVIGYGKSTVQFDFPMVMHFSTPLCNPWHLMLGILWSAWIEISAPFCNGLGIKPAFFLFNSFLFFTLDPLPGPSTCIPVPLLAREREIKERPSGPGWG